MMKTKCLISVALILITLLTSCKVQDRSFATTPITGPSQTVLVIEPIPSTEPTPLAPAEHSLQVPEGDYFDDALFVGDSIMEGIHQYTAAQRQEGECLGKAQFLTCSAGIALADLVGDWERDIQFSYQGQEQPLEEIVAEIAPQRVFLLLGMNDMAGAEEPVSNIIDRYIHLISSLQAVCQGIELIVITSPPKVASQWLPEYLPNQNFGNELIGEYAAALVKMCQKMDVPCVDLYTSLKDENGALPDAYCLDGYVHLNSTGAAAAVDTLNAFAEGR